MIKSINFCEFQMRVTFLVMFFLFTLSSVAQEYYQIDKKAFFKKQPNRAFGSQVIKQGEKLQLIGFENDNLKVIYQGEEGYIWEKNNPFTNEKALRKIDQLYFEYIHGERLKNLIITKVPKGNDNTIIIHSGLSAKEGYQAFGQYLIAKGFTFNKKDDEFFSIITAYKVLKQKRNDYLRYRLLATFFDNEIKIRVEFNDLESISYNKMIESDYFKNWQFIPNEKISQNLIFWDIAPIFEGFGKEYHYLQNSEFIDDSKRSKFKAILEAGYGIGIGDYGINRGGIDLILGSQVHSNFSIGLGAAVEKYPSPVFNDPDYEEPIFAKFEDTLYPVYTDFRVNFTNHRHSPFWATKIGFKFSAGPFINSKIGYEFRISNRGKMFLGLGYEIFRSEFEKLNNRNYSTMKIENNIQSIGFSVGYIYN